MHSSYIYRCAEKNPECDTDNFPGGKYTRGNLIGKNVTRGIHHGKMTKKNSKCTQRITVKQMTYFAIEFFFFVWGEKFLVNRKATCALFILFTYNGYNYDIWFWERSLWDHRRVMKNISWEDLEFWQNPCEIQVWEFIFRKVWKLNYEINSLSAIFKGFCLFRSNYFKE